MPQGPPVVGMTHYVVMTSGGLGSWQAARRTRDRLTEADHMTLLFADVKGRHADEPHVGEDEDTYRFLDDVARDLCHDLVTVADGRHIWEVFTDDRFLGNTRLANCSKFLKQRPCRAWLDEHADPADTVVVVGIDWSEEHRLPAIRDGWAPYPVWAPLTEAPFLDKAAMVALCEAAGIEVPRLYRAGFPHNNCGGFCVRAGQAQAELLLREHPARYAFHEGQEQRLREHLGKDVAILRDRTGGTLAPLTLQTFRERIEGQPSMFDALDYGGCGCFTEDPTRDDERPWGDLS